LFLNGEGLADPPLSEEKVREWGIKGR